MTEAMCTYTSLYTHVASYRFICIAVGKNNKISHGSERPCIMHRTMLRVGRQTTTSFYGYVNELHHSFTGSLRTTDHVYTYT